MAVRKAKPKGYEDELSEFKPCIFDSYCGEPVMWGFEIKKRLGEPEFSGLKKFGELVCTGGYRSSWFLITQKLTRAKAVKLYGPKGQDEYGPRGGWKSVTFGEKRFISDVFKTKAKSYRTTRDGTVCNGIRYDRKGNILDKE
jgi:hypothetical protein